MDDGERARSASGRMSFLEFLSRPDNTDVSKSVAKEVAQRLSAMYHIIVLQSVWKEQTEEALRKVFIKAGYTILTATSGDSKAQNAGIFIASLLPVISWDYERFPQVDLANPSPSVPTTIATTLLPSSQSSPQHSIGLVSLLMEHKKNHLWLFCPQFTDHHRGKFGTSSNLLTVNQVVAVTRQISKVMHSKLYCPPLAPEVSPGSAEPSSLVVTFGSIIQLAFGTRSSLFDAGQHQLGAGQCTRDRLQRFRILRTNHTTPPKPVQYLDTCVLQSFTGAYIYANDQMVFHLAADPKGLRPTLSMVDPRHPQSVSPLKNGDQFVLKDCTGGFVVIHRGAVKGGETRIERATLFLLELVEDTPSNSIISIGSRVTLQLFDKDSAVEKFVAIDPVPRGRWHVHCDSMEAGQLESFEVVDPDNHLELAPVWDDDNVCLKSWTGHFLYVDSKTGWIYADAKKGEQSSYFSFTKHMGIRVDLDKRKRKRGDRKESFSLPFNVEHKLQLTRNFEWKSTNDGTPPDKLFVVHEELGRGSYGSVFRANHIDGFELAVKEIRIDSTEDIQNEIEILKMCSHTNVVSYYGSLIKDGSVLWILMEFMPLGSVRDLIDKRQNPLNELELAYVAAHTLEGMNYLHSRGIIHRDVKAANILLNNRAEIKLADFGVSGYFGSLAMTKETVGTPLWMAPEVLRRKPATQASDVWSMGVTVIEMHDGVPPHADVPVLRAMRLTVDMKEPSPAFSATSSPSSPHLNDFLALMLVKRHVNRPSAFALLSHPFLLGVREDKQLRQHLLTSLHSIRGTEAPALSYTTPTVDTVAEIPSPTSPASSPPLCSPTDRPLNQSMPGSALAKMSSVHVESFDAHGIRKRTTSDSPLVVKDNDVEESTESGRRSGWIAARLGSEPQSVKRKSAGRPSRVLAVGARRTPSEPEEANLTVSSTLPPLPLPPLPMPKPLPPTPGTRTPTTVSSGEEALLSPRSGRSTPKTWRNSAPTLSPRIDSDSREKLSYRDGTASANISVPEGIDSAAYDGFVYSAGSNSRNQLGLPHTNTVLCTAPIPTFTSKPSFIVCGGHHSLVYDGDRLFSFGDNSIGQLGLDSSDPYSVPREIKSLSNLNIVTAACGFYHSFVLTSVVSPTPTPTPSPTSLSTMRATSEQVLYGFGRNHAGQLGHENVSTHSKPVRISIRSILRDDKIVQLACGTDHSLFCTASGKVYAMGSDKHGQLGLGEGGNVLKPTPVAFLSDKFVTGVAAQGHFSVALTRDGRLYSFGENTFGQLGLGSMESQERPQLISALMERNAVAVACGLFHTLILTDGALFACGRNNEGQLGIGEIETQSVTTPRIISYFTNKTVVSMTCGQNHSVVLCDDGQVFSFGANDHGQLGLGTRHLQPTPQLMPITVSRKATSVACNLNSTFVRICSGAPLCSSDRLKIVTAEASAEVDAPRRPRVKRPVLEPRFQPSSSVSSDERELLAIPGRVYSHVHSNLMAPLRAASDPPRLKDRPRIISGDIDTRPTAVSDSATGPARTVAQRAAASKAQAFKVMVTKSNDSSASQLSEESDLKTSVESEDALGTTIITDEPDSSLSENDDEVEERVISGTTVMRTTDSDASSEEERDSNSTMLLLEESDVDGDAIGSVSQRLSMGTTVVRFSDDDDASESKNSAEEAYEEERRAFGTVVMHDDASSEGTEKAHAEGDGDKASSTNAIEDLPGDTLSQRSTSKSSPNLPHHSLSLPQLPPLPQQPSTDPVPPEPLSPKSAHLQRNLSNRRSARRRPRILQVAEQDVAQLQLQFRSARSSSGEDVKKAVSDGTGSSGTSSPASSPTLQRTRSLRRPPTKMSLYEFLAFTDDPEVEDSASDMEYLSISEFLNTSSPDMHRRKGSSKNSKSTTKSKDETEEPESPLTRSIGKARKILPLPGRKDSESKKDKERTKGMRKSAEVRSSGVGETMINRPRSMLPASDTEMPATVYKPLDCLRAGMRVMIRCSPDIRTETGLPLYKTSEALLRAGVASKKFRGTSAVFEVSLHRPGPVKVPAQVRCGAILAGDFTRHLEPVEYKRVKTNFGEVRDAWRVSHKIAEQGFTWAPDKELLERGGARLNHVFLFDSVPHATEQKLMHFSVEESVVLHIFDDLDVFHHLPIAVMLTDK